MKEAICGSRRRATHRIAFLAMGIAAWGIFASVAVAAESRFPVLRAGSVTYSNVIVTGSTDKDIFIRHSKGLATVKVVDLDPTTRTALGFSPVQPRPASSPTRASSPGETNRSYRGILGIISDVGRKSIEASEEKARQEGRPIPKQDPVVSSLTAIGLLVGLPILYFFFCRSCSRLCRRAGSPSSFLVWLPGFKRLALFRATNISWWWFFLGLFIPFVGLCSWILCCLRVCEIFHRTRWMTVLMIFPFIGWPFFMYLDHISQEEDNDPAVRMQDRHRLAA